MEEQDDQEGEFEDVVTEEQLETAVGAEKPIKKHKKKKKKHFEIQKFSFEIPGVYKFRINDKSQESLGIVAGEDVTDEKPWIYIDKETILFELECNEQESELYPIKKQIEEFPASQILVGYISDDSKDYDEYYFCITEDAIVQVEQIKVKMEKQQKERLEYSLAKPLGRWHTLGSESEIIENRPKNTRPLIEVEIESKYPILPFKVHFKRRLAEDCRDGYMELRAPEYTNVLPRRRIDNYVQVTPIYVNDEAQTILKYPVNMATQYEYNITDIIEKFMNCEENREAMKQVFSNQDERIIDMLRVNATINFYLDDYEKLTLQKTYIEKFIPRKPKEFVCFINMELCDSKKVACVSWHPFLTGIVAATYVDIAPTIYLKNRPPFDEVMRCIHGMKPVLLWCCTDDLVPKLILETTREVFTLSFCPWNGDILIGGLSNGQIILWDISNKLEKVEEEEILTPNQIRYRNIMNSLMKWMKNIYNVKLVRPTAISVAQYSHSRCVNQIQWLSPQYCTTKTGQVEELPDGERSLQFVTSAEDGCLLIWDLLMVPQVTMGGFKPRRLKRLKKRPSALLAETSQFRPLHMTLRPIYKIKFKDSKLQYPMRISAFSSYFVAPIYRRKDSAPIKNLLQRLHYDLHSFEESDIGTNNVFIGSAMGNFIHAKWEGQNFDLGEVVNYEDGEIINKSKESYHDGPIVRIDYSFAVDFVLVLGGKVMSIWSRKLHNRPVIWRRSRATYTDGGWFLNDLGKIKATRIDGYLESWVLYNKSHEPYYATLLSSGSLNTISQQQREHKFRLIGFGEQNGAFSLYCIPIISQRAEVIYQDKIKSYLRLEITRKINFFKWQKKFNKKYETFLEKQREQKVESIDEGPPPPQIPEEEGEETVDNESAKKKDAKHISAAELLKQKQEKKEKERIRQMILTKKQLDTEQLYKDREPMIKLEEELEWRRQKQKQILRNADKIFHETVAMLFPDVVKEQPPPPHDPYKDITSKEEKTNLYEEYKNIAIEAQDYVDEHPFSYYFNWIKILKSTRKRRQMERGFYSHPHYVLVTKHKMQILQPETSAIVSPRYDNLLHDMIYEDAPINFNLEAMREEEELKKDIEDVADID